MTGCRLTSGAMAGNIRYPAECQRQLVAVGSTDRCNTLGERLGWGSIEQGFSWPFVELSGDGAELGLALQGQVGPVRQVLSQQPIGVFVGAALPG
jgi:hypothetical protein